MFIFIIRRKKYKKFYTPFKIYKSIVIVQEIIRSLLTTYIKMIVRNYIDWYVLRT